MYEKGAELIRMYHTLLGEELFMKGIDLYFERFDGQAVTTDDFYNAMNDASNNSKLGNEDSHSCTIVLFRYIGRQLLSSSSLQI